MLRLRPVCVVDEREYKVETGGVLIVELVTRQSGEVPYAAYFADLWVCLVCGHQIIGGYGEQPAAREHQPEKMQSLIDTFTEHKKIYYVR